MRKFKAKRFVPVVAVAVAVASCTNEAKYAEEPIDREVMPVRLAVADLEIQPELTPDDTSVVYQRMALFTSTDYDTRYIYAVDADGVLSEEDGTSIAYYPADHSPIDIIVVHPYTAVTDLKMPESFCVQADQSTETQYKASDLMWGKAVNREGSLDAQVLEMSHLMAKIVVCLTPGYDVRELRGVSINNIKRGCSVKLDTGTLESTESIPGQTSVNALFSKAGKSSVATALIPPQVISTAPFLYVRTNSGTAIYQFDKEQKMEAGCVYTLNITVNRSAVYGIGRITDWSNVENNKEKEGSL